VSRHGTVIPIPPDSQLDSAIEALRESWLCGYWSGLPYPRAAWLTHVEALLEAYFPSASSRNRNLTARGLAPFPLAHHP